MKITSNTKEKKEVGDDARAKQGMKEKKRNTKANLRVLKAWTSTREVWCEEGVVGEEGRRRSGEGLRLVSL